MAIALGQLEPRLLAYPQIRRLSAVRLGELAKPLRLTPTQKRHLLSRMARAGPRISTIAGEQKRGHCMRHASNGIDLRIALMLPFATCALLPLLPF